MAAMYLTGGVLIFAFAASVEPLSVAVGMEVFVAGLLLAGALLPSIVGLIDRGRRMRALPADQLPL